MVEGDDNMHLKNNKDIINLWDWRTLNKWVQIGYGC
jgi:hypothetical protein